MLYGMGPAGLSSALTLSGVPTTIEEARAILYRFRDGKPALVDLIARVTKFAQRERYIELWTGRRRHYPVALHWQEDESHTAMNNLIQGGVAELLRKSIQLLDHLFEDFRRRGYATPRMHLSIHDAILFSMRSVHVPFWLPRIKRIMEESYTFNVPIRAEFKVGERWAELKKVAA